MGYMYCYDYERPANYETRAVVRGNLAKNSYWPEYGDPSCAQGYKGPYCPSVRFTDMDYNRWYHLSVDYVVEKGIMAGVGSRLFGINDTTTRGMIVTILNRIDGNTAALTGSKFVDVPANRYFSNAVAWASEKGIVAGVSDTEFAPDASITREQMLSMLYRYAKYLGKNVNNNGDISKFEDVATVSNYAKEAMRWACGEGLISGSTGVGGKRYLNPKGNATRAEAAAFIERFMNNCL